ncbi:helix-turn-helix transcriptional regulator [Hydrogenophaga sp. 2FB]|uniref:helix-turn-helix domain-containing protein n=1 Tax=Hydrogenophaga sp. 2FB TaxID=2502187 RepID=UPI00207BBC3F|nr:helix-turn-helix transcriptional regulator [Hydrogenophaga sp. 2FB]
MPKRSAAIDAMPPSVLAHLRQLGENLAIARKRRRESLKDWAQRMGVSEPTLTRMEKGDPSVSMGVYATALWLIGRSQAMAEFAAPEHDHGALEDAVRVARARSVRKRPSLYGTPPRDEGGDA